MTLGHSHQMERTPPTTVSSGHVLSVLIEFAVLVAVLTRIAIPPTVLNKFIAYTTEEGGAIYEKIHPGSYLLVLLLPVVLLLRPFRLYREELPAVRALVIYTAGTVLLIALLIPLGRSNSAGYFIDTYAMTGAGGLLLYTLSAAGRLRIAGAVIAVLALSALLGMFESVTQIRLLPYDYGAELTFRPTGLSGHPLMLGLLNCAVIGFAWAMPWPMKLRLALVGFFILGTVFAEARFATILAGLTVLFYILLSSWPGFTARQQRRGKILMLSLLALLTIPAFLLLQAMGSRLSGGLVDESTMARIDVYRVFGYVGLRDILMGADIAWITRIIQDDIGIEIVESTPVILIFQLGLPAALAFTGLMVFLFWRLCRAVGLPERLSTIAFFIVALSNITLSTKTAAVLIVVVLLVALQKPLGTSNSIK